MKKAEELADKLLLMEQSGLVVHDAAALVLKQPDDLAAVIAQRVAAEKANEEAQRERIRAEEAARMEREAKAETDRLERERAQAAQADADRIAREQAESAARMNQALTASAMTQPIVEKSDPMTLDQMLGEVAPVAAAILKTSIASVRPEADNGTRLTLGAINDRLAPVSINVAGLSALGFEPVEQVKASRFYRECDFPAICRAISAHVLAACATEVAA